MKKMNKSRVRRCNCPWTEEEIEHLTKWKLVDFLPAEYAEDETLPAKEQQRTLKVITPLFTPEQIEQLEHEAKSLQHQDVEGGEREQAILRAAMRATPRAQGASGINCAATYLYVLLGIKTSLSGMGVEAAKLTDHRWLRRQSLVQTAQGRCFLDWTAVHNDLWSSPTWKECLTMRYATDDPAAVDLLSTSTRRILDREARRLKEEVGADNVTEEQFNQAVNKVGRTWSIGEALPLICIEYLRARLHGPIPPEHSLNMPISQSGLFPRIAATAAEREATTKQTASWDIPRFLRYLQVSRGHADELVGQILYGILRLETDLCDHPKAEPPMLAGIRWPARLKPEATQIPRDYRRIADRFAPALEIERNVFTEIWRIYAKLMLKRYWVKRASVNMTAFWAAKLLEGCKSDVYRTYGRLIDFFHREGIKPLIKEEKSGKADGPMRRAILAPFIHALIHDPLLNCVFHSEVFKGRNRLFPRTEKLRADNLVRSQMIAYTVHRLRKERPETPTVAVTYVLPESMGLPNHVRYAMAPSGRKDSIKWHSPLAYAAVLVAALVNDPYWRLTPEKAKDIYHRHKDDAEVLHLLEGPDQQSIFTIRGES